MRRKTSFWQLKGFRWWLMRLRGKLAVWLVERLYGEDMLWDADDPEQCFYDLEEWARSRWDWEGFGDETHTFTVQRALGLPTKAYEITRKTREDSDDEDFIVVPVKR